MFLGVKVPRYFRHQHFQKADKHLDLNLLPDSNYLHPARCLPFKRVNFGKSHQQ